MGGIALLAACGSVQEPLTPSSEEQALAGGSIRGTVLTEGHDVPHASLTALRAGGSDQGTVFRAADAGADVVPGQVLVRYRDGASGTAGRSTASGGAVLRLQRADDGGRTELVALDGGEDVPAAVERLARDPNVARVTPNYYLHLTALPNDPYLPQQWGLTASGVPFAWSSPRGQGEPVVVAVIDSGFQLDHEDLAGRFLPGYDFCANVDCTATDADPSNGSAVNWHGTHVAGVIGAWAGNGIGVSGVADAGGATILPVKVFNDDGAGANTAVLIDALRWAAGLPVENVPTNRNPARVINLSLAGNFPSDILQDTLDEVRAAGALVIASTGNAGVDRVMSPAAADGVVGVGASNKGFRRSCFSNHGVGALGPGGVDILAPGGEANGSTVACGIEPGQVEGLMSTIPGDGYGSAIGTSMAAPMVAGAAALILAADPTLDVDGLEERLLGSAYFDAGYMNEGMYGAGVLRADRALGLPGPGDTVSVELVSRAAGETLATSVSLGLSGVSTSYSFHGVAAGEYELTAKHAANAGFAGRATLTLSEGEDRQANLVLQSNR